MTDKNVSRRAFLKQVGTGIAVVSAPVALDSILDGETFRLAAAGELAAGKNVFPESDLLNTCLGRALGRGADFADIYCERTIIRKIDLREGAISSIEYNIDQGTGVRAVYGEQSGYAFCEDFSEPTMLQAADLASTSGKQGNVSQPVPLSRQVLKTDIVPQREALTTLPEEKRITVMKQAEQAGMAVNPAIKEVRVSYYEEIKEIIVANSQGLLVRDVQPLIYFSVNAFAHKGKARHMSRNRIGQRSGFEMFDNQAAAACARTAAEEAVIMLDARPAPSGEMPVVVTNGWGGILFHEAVGHGLEGDAVSSGNSFFAEKVGQAVASDIVTFIDDATLPNHRGSYNVDDEGVPAARKVLIDKGILTGYMQDRQSARKMGKKSTGNGRRESFRHLPMVRMTNTFILAGQDNADDIIGDTKKGIYARNFAGGVVDTTSGNFTFTVSAAWLIENGKLTAPIRQATLIGKGSDALKSIDRIADDLDFAPGTCGKGQWVPITSGQPTLRLSKLVVGGTKA